MKIIEAMKRVKANQQKVADLQVKIRDTCANYKHETPQYNDPKAKINEWLQSCEDLSQENVRLLVAIQRTNLQTTVPIELGGVVVTKTIAEWVWRRREYANVDYATFSQLTDRGLKEGIMKTSTGEMEVKIDRHYQPDLRDKKVAMYREEPLKIDSALEVINAVTELIE